MGRGTTDLELDFYNYYLGFNIDYNARAPDFLIDFVGCVCRGVVQQTLRHVGLGGGQRTT